MIMMKVRAEKSAYSHPREKFNGHSGIMRVERVFVKEKKTIGVVAEMIYLPLLVSQSVAVI